MSNDPFDFWYIIGGMTVHIEKKKKNLKNHFL